MGSNRVKTEAAIKEKVVQYRWPLFLLAMTGVGAFIGCIILLDSTQAAYANAFCDSLKSQATGLGCTAYEEKSLSNTSFWVGTCNPYGYSENSYPVYYDCTPPDDEDQIREEAQHEAKQAGGKAKDKQEKEAAPLYIGVGTSSGLTVGAIAAACFAKDKVLSVVNSGLSMFQRCRRKVPTLLETSAPDSDNYVALEGEQSSRLFISF